MTKKLISTLTSIALLAGVAAMPAAAEETYALGDVTMDGVVDIRDAIEICKYYSCVVIQEEESPLTEEQIQLIEVTQDGIVDLCDAVEVMKYYVYTLSVDDSISFEDFRADSSIYDSNHEAIDDYCSKTYEGFDPV